MICAPGDWICYGSESPILFCSSPFITTILVLIIPLLLPSLLIVYLQKKPPVYPQAYI